MSGIERIADTVKGDLLPLGRTVIEKDMQSTATTRHILTSLYQRVCDAVRMATGAIGEVDQNMALEVVNMKPEINGLITEALQYQADGVTPTESPELITNFRMEDEFIDALHRIYQLSKRLARLMLPAAVTGREA